MPTVLPGSCPLPRSRPLERRTRATRLFVLARPVLGARNLALPVASERLTRGPGRLYFLAVMLDRLIPYDAAGAEASPEQAAL